MENLVGRCDLERVLVNLVDGSSVAWAKPALPGLDPFEGSFLYAFLILKNSVFVSIDRQ